MGRPARFDADTLLDEALALAAEGGPEAVTMAAVAARAGAPSGSVYHRFAGRSALLAALWLRTVARFQVVYLEALAGPDPRAAAIAASRSVVDFSRARPDHAAVLLQGAGAFGSAGWPEGALAQAHDHAADVDRALRTLARRLGRQGVDGHERMVLAVVDVPYAIVRRHLRAGDRIPPRAAKQAGEATAAILGFGGVGHLVHNSRA